VHPTIPYSIAPFTSYIFNINNALNETGLAMFTQAQAQYFKNSGYFNDLLKLSDIESDSSIISFVTTSIWDGNLSETSHITSIGNILYTSHSIWLIITSIILLLAMVGAIVITIKPKN
jgi:NADH-ubiquinone/plastoquinone oxidoreductase chain 6